MRAITVSPSALTDIGMARSYLGIEASTDPRESALLAFDINAATTDIETYVSRLLKSRAYTGANVLTTVGDGSGKLIAEQHPVTAVTSAKWLGTDGTLTALDLTGIQFDGNLILLPNDTAPSNRTVQIDCEAGYKAGYKFSHDHALSTLEGVCLRIVEIKRSDRLKHVGRGIEVKVSEGTVKYEATQIPADLRALLAPFRRIGTG